MSDHVPQWWKVRFTASCEMTCWVKASDSESARLMFEINDYEESTPWEVRSAARVKMGRVKPALGFVPERDNP